MLDRCRERVPGVAISSDFIVGFCGETEESFQRTCDLVRTAEFQKQLHLQIQPSAGNQGHELYADDIPEEVKKRRNNDLLAIQNAVSLQDHLSKIGEVVEVLVEGPSKSAERQRDIANEWPQLTGRTMTDHIVVFEGRARLIGQTVKVRVTEATAFTLFGEVETEERVGVEREFREPFVATGQRSQLAHCLTQIMLIALSKPNCEILRK